MLVSSHILPEVEAMTSQIILIDRGKVLAEGGVTEIRDKIPEHPTTVALVFGRVPPAGRLPGRPGARGGRGGRDCRTGRVIVRTDHALGFYRALPGWILENDLTVDEILTLDDSLEAVFQYLTER